MKFRLFGGWFGWALLGVGLLVVGCGEARVSRMQEAMADGRAFLSGIQRGDGAICDTVNPLFDVWETALAAKALFALQPDTSEPTLKAALAFLRANENAAGLVCHNQACRASYCLETSAVYLGLLADIHGFAYIEPRLDTIRRMQLASGAWKIGNPDVAEHQSFPSVTGFVLGLLLRPNKPSFELDSAYHWLLAQQRPDGSWGRTWEYYNLDGYALWPICEALQRYSRGLPNASLDRAVAYITKTQQPQGNWLAIDPAFPKMPSTELHTALMLQALEASGRGNPAVMARGKDYLLDHQRTDGSWSGGFFPIQKARYVKEEYVFATAMTLLVLGSVLPERH